MSWFGSSTTARLATSSLTASARRPNRDTRNVNDSNHRDGAEAFPATSLRR